MVTNHGFSDGNKRTALYLVELLIQRSGYELVEEDPVLVEKITGVAKGEIGYVELCEWFRNRLNKVQRQGHCRRNALESVLE